MSHFPLVRRAAAVVVAGIVLAACSSGGGETRMEAATVEPTVAPVVPVDEPATTTTIDLTSVPAELDEDYVQAVVDELDRGQQAAFAAAREEAGFGPAFEARYAAIYSQAGRDRYLPRIRQAGIDTVAEEPGVPETKVLELRSATAACIHALTRRDLGPILAAPYEGGSPHHVKLVRAAPTAMNPTAWVIDFDSYIADGSDPGDLC